MKSAMPMAISLRSSGNAGGRGRSNPALLFWIAIASRSSADQMLNQEIATGQCKTASVYSFIIDAQIQWPKTHHQCRQNTAKATDNR